MKQLAILTYNVHCMPGEIYSYEEDRMANVIHYLEQMAKKYTLDVIVLCEAFHPQFQKQFKTAFAGWHVGNVLNQRQVADLHMTLMPPFIWANMQVNGGVIIATRLQPLSSHSIEFSQSCQFDGLAAKGVLHVQIQKDDQMVHVFGTHMQSFEVPVLCDSGVRASQFAEFQNMVKELTADGIIKKDHIVLYLGDFNESLAPENALSAKVVRCKKSCSCSTFDARQLDYVMYSAAHKQPTMSQTKVVGSRSQLSRFSDHFPLLGLLTF